MSQSFGCKSCARSSLGKLFVMFGAHKAANLTVVRAQRCLQYAHNVQPIHAFAVAHAGASVCGMVLTLGSLSDCRGLVTLGMGRHPEWCWKLPCVWLFRYPTAQLDLQ